MKHEVRRNQSSLLHMAAFITLVAIIIGIFSSSVLSQSKLKLKTSDVLSDEENSGEIQSVASSQQTTLRSPSAIPIFGDHYVGFNQEFLKLVDAVTALKTNGISGPVRLLLSDSIYIEPPIVLTGVPGSGGVNNITIQPSYGITNCVISLGVDNTENGCFVIKQMNNVVINGMNADGSSLNALTIQYDESQSEPVNQYTGAIRIISSSDIQIYNTKILGRFNPEKTKGYDAISSVGSTTLGSCTNISIQDCIITRGRYGINQNGASSIPDRYWYLSMNLIGGAFAGQLSASPTNDIRDSLTSGGINLNRIDSSSIQLNYIDGILMPQQILYSTVDNRIDGISAASATNLEIRGNTVNNILWDRSDGSVAKASGIRLSGNLSLVSPGNNQIINNGISNINSLKDLCANPQSSVLVSGIYVTQDLFTSIFHNSVWLSQPSTNCGINTCLYVYRDGTNPAEMNVLNNAFVNSSTNGTGTVTVLFSNQGCTDFSTEDHNVLYSPTGIIHPDAPNIEVWNSQCGHSQSSVSGDPLFISTSDLHLTNFGLSYANNVGIPIEIVANDRDGEMRSWISPDAGCDENLTLQQLTDVQPFAVTAGYMYGTPEGQPHNIIVRGKNNGFATESFIVQVSVKDSSGTTIFSQTEPVNVQPLEFFTVGTTTTWVPPVFGSFKTYSLEAVTQHAADQFPANDLVSTNHSIFPVFNGTNYTSTFETSSETDGWLGTGDWTVGEPQKLGGTHSGVSAWATKLTDMYSSKKHSFLFSPYFDLSTNQFPKIQFSHSILTEPSWDGSIFQFTTNMGATWEMMDNLGAPYSSNWYDPSLYQNTDGFASCYDQTTAVAPDGSMFPQGPKWTSNGDCFETDVATGPFGYFTTFRQSDEIAGLPLVQFRYWTFSDGANVDSGWAFDDFSLKVDSGGRISGLKFEDINKNGTRDSGEPGLAGWTINLQGPFAYSVQTDTNGNYSFEYLPEGIYIISESLKAGWVKTFPSFEFYNISLNPGNMTYENIDFGNFELGKIRVELSVDVNGNGILDSVDNAPLPGGTNAVISVRRDSTYNFVTPIGNNTLGVWITNLDLGTYEIEETTIPSGWILTTASGSTGVTINTSGFVGTIRLMNFKKIIVSGIKFHDLNTNGLFDVGEPGLPSWLITLNGGITIATDNSGYYEFIDIGPGTYTVAETNQEGWFQSTPSSGDYSFIAFSGNNITDKNFGNYMYGSISGMKFNDLNYNGVKDSAEPGLANWKIMLRGTLAETTFTNTNGYYEFNNLPLGSYKVHEVYQAGWEQSFPSDYLYKDTINTSGQTFVDQDFGNYQLPNSLSGMKFFDINANGVKDSLEPGLENWKIKLFDSTRNTVRVDTTDSLGNYSFQNLPDGVYIIKEVLKDEWVQTHPRTVDVATGYQPGVYILKLSQGISKTGLDFGNTIACRYIGPVGGSWRDPANWSCGHPPDAGTPIIIPRDTSVVIDSLPSDSIHSVRIQQGGRILFGALNRLLRIQGRLQIDSGGSLSFAGGAHLSPSDNVNGLVLYGDWINNGTFEPGQSTIIFSGDSAKSIVAGDIVDGTDATLLPVKVRTPNDYTSNSFYNLVIDGENTNLIGNMRIQNTLSLYSSLNTRVEDTITIENPSPGAIDSTGILPRGSIKRLIDATGGTYRFESMLSTLSFNEGEELPDTVLVTTLPDTTTNVFNLQWKVVGGELDTTLNTITIDSLGKFSKWVLGKPGAGFNKSTNASIQFGTPTVDRMYTITTSGGGNFYATMQLRYNDGELKEGESEDVLKLLQGPVVADTLKQNWNMVSVPVLPETTYEVSALFPSANSDAFKYLPGNGYVQQSVLDLGIGYWLKFPASEYVGILGDEQTSLTVNVESGWNMIGTVSFPLAASSVIDTAGAGIAGLFFGYNSGYFVADTLKAMRAYWIKVNNNGSLTLQSNGLGTGKASTTYNMLHDLHKLTLTDVDENRQTLYYASNNEIDESKFEMPPLPPSGIFDVRFGNGTIAVFNHNEMVREIPIQISAAAYPVTISWDVKNQSSRSAELMADERTIPISGKGQVSITSPNAKLRLMPLTNASVPLQFMLYQNYPNPFNPSTTIRYDIPVEGLVTLKVFNVLGQVVTTLAENELAKAGRYSRTFNLTLPSGVYFYRSIVSDANSPNHSVLYQSQRKMLLIK